MQRQNRLLSTRVGYVRSICIPRFLALIRLSLSPQLPVFGAVLVAQVDAR